MLFLLASHWDFKGMCLALSTTLGSDDIDNVYQSFAIRCHVVYPRSTELALHEGNSGLVFTGVTSKNVTIFIGWCRGTAARHCRLRWVCLHWIVPRGPWKNHRLLLVLLLNALDLPMHGNLFGENNETGPFFRG
ncbi:hypothetical protein E3N88_36460 [Mikania micrantha]|uniref:Uncharacterized protein n=1 Tax=Mikania micrantha TaxID=192012 RepID=A0A5N6M3S1_9ASTR|nr:hypothetical protein E3N88_36460 [Mikania micrantha]